MLFDKGCVVNSIYHYPINLVFFTTPELLEIGDIPMTSLNEKPGRTEALKYYRRVADLYKLNIHQYERVLGFNGERIICIHRAHRHGCAATELVKSFWRAVTTISRIGSMFQAKISRR